jgi:hypothetical protein
MYAKPHIAPITAKAASADMKRKPKIAFPHPRESFIPDSTEMAVKNNINDVTNVFMQNESKIRIFFLEVRNAAMAIGIMAIAKTICSRTII